ncbi:MAG TPA: hypothetical protein VLI94_03740 [Solirubrobacterales bacterium]|nr:hypothetical protein [Solirubrobacterales bacterium]
MTVELRTVEVERNEARDWMVRSLRQGFDLSSAVLAEQPFDKGHFLALIPTGLKTRPLNFAAGGVTQQGASAEALGDFLAKVAGRGAASVVVEHDMARASDPVLVKETEPLALIGERVLHWCDLRDGARAGAKTIIRGAHGHPLNAFLTKSTSAELGLADRQQIPEDLPRLLVESLVAVVVSAFDGESFLIWIAND